METNQWIIDAMNKSYNHQDFNTQYRSLAILGNQSGEPETALLVVEFLSSIQSFFEDIELDLTTTNKNESTCQHCADKDKLIELKNETIQILKQNIEAMERVIDTQHNAIFSKSNNLKVCKK